MARATTAAGLTALLLLVGGAPVAPAAVHSSLLSNVVSEPSGEYASAQFDFGTAFRRIDQVSIELTVPYDFGGYVSTGHSSHSTSFVVDVFGRGGEPHFDPYPGIIVVAGTQSNPNTLRAGFSMLTANLPTEMRLLALGARFDLENGSGLIGGEWPSFLLTGRGDARLCRLDSYSSWRSDGWRQSYEISRAPESLTSVRLIIDGIAVPEPTPSVMIFSILLSAVAVRRR